MNQVMKQKLVTNGFKYIKKENKFCNYFSIK